MLGSLPASGPLPNIKQAPFSRVAVSVLFTHYVHLAVLLSALGLTTIGYRSLRSLHALRALKGFFMATKNLETFTEKLKEIKNRISGGATVGNINSVSQLNNFLDDIIEEGIKAAQNSNETPERIFKSLTSSNKYSHKRSIVVASFNSLFYKNEQYEDLYKSTAKADRGEKFRALILRILTAISIATIILTTSYLAKIWDIPLPLRMGLTG